MEAQVRNWILLLAALVAAASIFLWPRSEGFRLSDLSPQKVSSIRVEKQGMPEISLERKGDSWEIVAPKRGGAKMEAVKKILSILEARSDQKLKAENLARFGLDKPELRVHFDDVEFDFGILNPLTGQQYVKCGNAVYLVSAKYALIPSLGDIHA
jgi:hypothetical protein